MKTILGACVLALLAGTASAQYVVDSGTPDQTGNASVFYVNPTLGQILAQKFTLAQDATISKFEIFANGFNLPLHIDLVNKIGPTATPGNVVTSFGISVPHVSGVNNGSWAGTNVNLCLAAGDYYLVFSDTTNSNSLITKPATNIGTSYFASQGNGDINIAFPPGSTFLSFGAAAQFGVRITGTNGVVPGTWVDRGFALAGVAGLPALVGSGSLVGGSAGLLNLSNAKPSALSVLQISLTSAALPFKGGMLVAVPAALSLSLTTGAGGSLNLPFTWPLGLPSATSLWFQYLISDNAAVQHVALSNAVRATTP